MLVALCVQVGRFEVAHDISSRKANKGYKFEEGLYTNISFLQLPSHISNMSFVFLPGMGTSSCG